MRPSRPIPSRLLVSALAAALSALLATGALAQGPPTHGSGSGPKLPAEDLQRIAGMAADSAQAVQAITELRAYMKQGPEGMYRQWAFNTLLLAQLRSNAPTDDVVASAESLATTLPTDYQRRVGFFVAVSEVLAERPDALDRSLAYARKALEEVPPTPDALPALAIAKSAEGYALMRQGATTAAIAALLEALPDSPDSQRVLTRLGRASEQAKKDDDAIRYYVRSLGSFPGPDTSAAEPLRAAWTRRHGSLKGLDETVQKARTTALRRVALDQRKTDAVPFDFSLPEVTDSTKTVALASYAGKVTVIDFWGSWCGPCRAEMPLFQALADRYRDRPEVAFLGVNWEQRQGDAATRRQKARDFIASMKLTFPSALDLEAVAVRGFGVEGFPTVFVIDRAGKVRYANRGFAPGIDEILAAQIESLLGR